MQVAVLYGSRLRAFWLALGSLLMSAAAVFALLGQPTLKLLIAGWIGVIMAPLAAVLGAIQVWRPPALQFTDDALVIENGFRKPTIVRWADLETFRIWRMRNSDFIGYMYRPGREPKTALMRINAALGIHGLVTVRPNLKTKALLGLLNECLADAQRHQGRLRTVPLALAQAGAPPSDPIVR